MVSVSPVRSAPDGLEMAVIFRLEKIAGWISPDPKTEKLDQAKLIQRKLLSL